MRIKLYFICYFVLCVCALGFATTNTKVAVTYFTNLSGAKDKDYIGFQIADFITNALNAYPGLTVIERIAVDKILQEQELQLSGLTTSEGAVKIGKLANVTQIIVGSYIVSKNGELTITARIIDVSTGEVLGSASVTGIVESNIFPLCQDLVIKLLSSTKGYSVTFAIEGKLDSLSDDDLEMSINFAKAMEANFRKDNNDEILYLSKIIQNSAIPTNVYLKASKMYQSAISQIDGQSMYGKMLSNQLIWNEKLNQQIEPLTNYYFAMNALARKLNNYISSDSIEIQIDKKEQFSVGTTSAVVTLPRVTLKVRNEEQLGVRRIFNEQNFIALGAKGLQYRQQPPGGALLSPKALEGLFDVYMYAEVSCKFVFRDKNGAELWSIVSKPVNFLRIDALSQIGRASGRERV